jgi:7-cyano-7-deazaguanine synthase in queuosine biosynthesis
MSPIDPVNRPTGRSVLLFSGGLDTVASAWLLRPDVLLFLPHGQRYVAMETAAVASLVRDHLLPPTCEVITCDALRLSAFERPDAIIPSRNLLFVTAAAWFGERVFLGAMAGDRTLDKSPGFFARATELLSYLYGPQYWCEGRTVEVRAVFEGRSPRAIS